MKPTFIALLALCLCVPVVVADKEPLIADPNVEKEIRKQLKKPTGELTKADLEKVTKLSFRFDRLTEVPKGLEKLTHLESLSLCE